MSKPPDFRIAWAGNFLAAGKLSKRGYKASFNKNNVAGLDLSVFNPQTDRTYTVHVNTRRHKSAFPIHRNHIRDDHVYVFIFLNDFDERETFFVVGGAEILSDTERFFGRTGRDATKKRSFSAISYDSLNEFQDRWEVFDEKIVDRSERRVDRRAVVTKLTDRDLRSRWGTDDGIERRDKVLAALKAKEDCQSILDGFPGVDAMRSGLDLRGVNLDFENLRSANLQTANLENAALHNAVLAGANLRGANLIGADLVGAKLMHANLTGANLRRAELINSDLSDANLTDANLTDANLIGADLSRVNERGAKMTGADLRGAKTTRPIYADRRIEPDPRI
jgi:uncharacterized protein YjbI with pentapeptide repeats